MQEINTLLIALDKTWDDDLLPLCSQIFRRDIRASSRTDTGRSSKSSWIPETESRRAEGGNMTPDIILQRTGIDVRAVEQGGMMRGTNYGSASSQLQKFIT